MLEYKVLIMTALVIVKGKGFPLQAWSGSWGSRRLRLLDFLDFRQYEGGKVALVIVMCDIHRIFTYKFIIQAKSSMM